MQKNYIEIKVDDTIHDFEKEMLSGVNIPSLLPVNIVNQDDHSLVCFITTGYKTVSNINIDNIETLATIIKSFVKAIIISEQYLLMGGKHFLDTDMVFYNSDLKEAKLVFGKSNDRNYHYGNITVVSDFIDSLKKTVWEDKVLLQFLDQVINVIDQKNPELKGFMTQIEEIERRWYCKNVVKTLPFSKASDSAYKM